VDAAEVIGWLGGALVISRLVPQAVRLLRTRQTAGISRVGALCWVGNDLGWLAYGLRADLAPLWAPSAVLLVLDSLIVVLLARSIRPREALTGLGWVGAVVVAVGAGQEVLAVALVAGSATGTLPHGWHALRARDLSGIAPAAWALALADGALWGIYGFARGDAAVTWYAALTLGTAVVVLWRLRVTRSDRRLRHLDPQLV
jgi:MtN3 and saliva related transmembrane protein